MVSHPAGLTCHFYWPHKNVIIVHVNRPKSGEKLALLRKVWTQNNTQEKNILLPPLLAEEVILSVPWVCVSVRLSVCDLINRFIHDLNVICPAGRAGSKFCLPTQIFVRLGSDPLIFSHVIYTDLRDHQFFIKIGKICQLAAQNVHCLGGRAVIISNTVYSFFFCSLWKNLMFVSIK